MGAGAKSPSPLAPFAHNWVGGDIRGLSAFAGTLYGYVPEMATVATALEEKVSQIVGGAGWQGSAATGFTKAWDHDAAGVSALVVMISAAGDVVNTLAVNLASIESALEQAAVTAIAHGVQVGADGQPPQVCYADQAKESWRVGYESFWNRCMLLATQARTTAAGALQQLGATVTAGGADSGLEKGDWTALGDVLAGFLGAQTRYRAFVAGQLPDVRRALAKAFDAAVAENRQANGRFGAWTDENKADYAQAKTALSAVEDNLAQAQSAENPFSKAWGFSPSDISSLSSKLDGLGSTGGDLARFAADLPLIDIAAAGAGTYFGAQQDMADGVPSYAAYPLEAGGNIAALGVGGWVGGLATGGAATALGGLGVTGVGLSMAAGGVGVLAGGVVAYGVGDFTHNLIDENWGADFQHHGIVAGLGYGIGDSAVKTGQDFAKLGTGIAHTAEHLWDSVF